MMATTPTEDEPGFETDVNELPEGDKGSESTLEDSPQPEAGDAAKIE
jgi:hypothetical protein